MEFTVTDTSGEAPAVREKNLTKQSNFLITISTNFKPKSTGQSVAIADKLRGALAQVFSQEQLPDCLEFSAGGVRDIKKVEISYNVELGHDPKGARIHSHATVEISHNAHLRMNLAHLRAIVPALIHDERVKSVYLNVKTLPSNMAARAYLRKEGYNPASFSRGASASAAEGDGDLEAAMAKMAL